SLLGGASVAQPPREPAEHTAALVQCLLQRLLVCFPLEVALQERRTPFGDFFVDLRGATVGCDSPERRARREVDDFYAAIGRRFVLRGEPLIDPGVVLLPVVWLVVARGRREAQSRDYSDELVRAGSGLRCSAV